MMKNTLKGIGLLTTSALLGTSAYAQQEFDDEMAPVVEVDVVDVGIYQSAVQLTPRIGTLGYENENQDYDARITQGIGFRWNPAATADILGPVALGIDTGFLYSHLAEPDANFFGAGGEEGISGANAWIFPAQVVGGVTLFENLHIAGLAGAHAIYRSAEGSMLINEGDTGTDDSFNLVPAFGLEAGWEVSDVVALGIRGDWMPTGTGVDDLFTATLGATFPLAR
jgi:hypothetical protein